VWRILKRLELNRLPTSQRYKRHDRRWKRYEKPLPGHRVQLDVRFIAPLPGAPRPGSPTSSPRSTTAPGCGSCASIPNSTSRPPSSSWTTWRSASRSGSRSSRPTTGPSSAPASTGTSWTRHRPRLHQAEDATAQWQGGTLHRIDAEEFYRLLDGVVIDDAQVFNDKLREWEDFYNYHRPHGDSTARRPMKTQATHPGPV
jgi:hypothetical protein